jgi:hypothetical protein
MCVKMLLADGASLDRKLQHTYNPLQKGSRNLRS